MVHKNAGQLERLIKALAHEEADFYIHVDKRADFEPFVGLASLPRVHFIQERYWARWASFRFTQAILQSIREILATGIAYDFINLLSGQDYPIKPVARIHEFLGQHVGRSFLSFEPAGSAWWQHAIARVESYHTIYFEFKFQYALQGLLNRVLPKRKFPLPYTLYGGPDGSWWTITRECAAYLIEFMDRQTAVRRFSYFTWGSDEFLVATILMNSPFKSQVINDNYRYIDWSAGGANPKVLTLADAPRLAQSPKLFARKFDVAQDPKVLDLLDQSLTGSQSAVSD